MMTQVIHSRISYWHTVVLLTVVGIWLGTGQYTWAVKTGSLYKLTTNRAVEVTTAGNGIQSVTVKLHRITKDKIIVQVPVGTFFVSRNAKAQNMVTVASTIITLTDNDWYTLNVPVACANRTRAIPKASDTFTVRQSPEQLFLERVIPLMEQDHADYAVKQAVVWIITDNVTYSELGILKSTTTGVRVIDVNATAKAMRYCAIIGMDLTQRAIWRDRQLIFPKQDKMADNTLLDWLSYDSTSILIITSTPPGAAVTLDGVPTGKKTPCQFTILCHTRQPRSVDVSLTLPDYIMACKTIPIKAKMNISDTFSLHSIPPAGTLKTILPGVKAGAELINPRDGARLVWVPAGEFLMGSTENDRNASRDEKPQRTVFLDGFWIYATEVTMEQYYRFCLATGREFSDLYTGALRDNLMNHPISNVMWEDAAAYAAWVGASLPTEAQWEKAARGTDGRRYPWGDAWDAGKKRCSKSQSDKASGPTDVGSFPSGMSPYGCQDMAGNVVEWCSDWYDEAYYRQAPSRNPTGPAKGEAHVVRGGAYSLYDSNLFRVSARMGIIPMNFQFLGDMVGFRCVMRPLTQ